MMETRLQDPSLHQLSALKYSSVWTVCVGQLSYSNT